MNRSHRLARIFVGAAVLALGAGGTAAVATSPAPIADARELVIARDMDLTTLDPGRVYCDTCQIYMSAVYETLVGVDPADLSVLVPRLAESWEVNEDSTEFTFHLDPAAAFADGAPVTSADVKFSWDRLAGLAGSASYLMGGATVETPDPATVVVTFEQPNSAFLSIASAPYLAITNSALATENGATTSADDDAAEGWFLENSAGSGPFVLESYSEGDQLVLARNDSYWGTPSPFPGVTLLQVAESTAQLQQLQAGDVDIAMQISFDSVGQLDGVEGVTTDIVNSYNFVYVALSPGVPGGEELTPEVRQAIKLAIDYDGVLDTTVGGNGRLQAAPIPNGFTGTADLPLPAQDVAAAQALLDEAGVDGLTLRAAYPALNVYGVDFDTLMAKVQQDLSAVGIELELEPLEFSQWVEQILGDGIPVTAVYFAPDHVDSSQYIQYFGMIPESAWQGRSGSEVSQEQTDLFVQALAAGGDEKESLYAQLGELMIDDTIILPLVNPDLVLAYASDLTGVRYSACCNLELGGVGVS